MDHQEQVRIEVSVTQGKTLMARQIGKMLNATEPLIVNGPEILNKFVGASEENVRKLFAPAEAEYKVRFGSGNKRQKEMHLHCTSLSLMNWMLFVNNEDPRMMGLVLGTVL